MPRNSKVVKKQRSGQSRPAANGRIRRGRPKTCQFCSQRATWVDYKDVVLLRRFLSERGRIKARGTTGNCAQHQRDVAVAVKTAREVALLPYSVRSVASEPGERRGRRGRPAPDRPGDSPASETDAEAGSDAVPESTTEIGSEDSQVASDV